MVLEFKMPKVRMRSRTAEQTALDVAFRKRMRSIQKEVGDKHEDDPDSGVVFLSNLPHAFCEYPMYKYFSQFGRIKRLRLSRSKKSAKSKGYAYIEFEYADVAKIVAQTMNNYLMYRKLIKCKFVPKDELHEDTFKGCFRQFGQPRGRMNSIRRHNSYAAAPDTERIGRNLMRRAGQEIKKEQILKEMGIDFKIDGYKNVWDATKTSLYKTRTRETQNSETIVEDDDEEAANSREADSTGSEIKEIEETPSQDTSRKSRRRKNMSAEKDTSDNVSDEEQDSSEVVDDEAIPVSATETLKNSSNKGMKRSRRRIKAEDEKPSDAGETKDEENLEAEKTPASRKTVKKDKMTPKRRKKTPKK